MKILGIIVVILLVTVGVGLASLYVKIPRYHKYWQKRAAHPVAQDALVYVALGDSTAQGIGATRPEKGYVGLIADALEQKHGRPVHVVNLSKSGAKLSDCLRDQLPKLTDIQADIITVGIGANDMSTWDPESFRTDMDTLMTGLPKKNADQQHALLWRRQASVSGADRRGGQQANHRAGRETQATGSTTA